MGLFASIKSFARPKLGSLKFFFSIKMGILWQNCQKMLLSGGWVRSIEEPCKSPKNRGQPETGPILRLSSSTLYNKHKNLWHRNKTNLYLIDDFFIDKYLRDFIENFVQNFFCIKNPSFTRRTMVRIEFNKAFSKLWRVPNHASVYIGFFRRQKLYQK